MAFVNIHKREKKILTLFSNFSISTAENCYSRKGFSVSCIEADFLILRLAYRLDSPVLDYETARLLISALRLSHKFS